jgi:hypothetical protein
MCGNSLPLKFRICQAKGLSSEYLFPSGPLASGVVFFTPEKAPTNRWAAFGWHLAEWMLIRALVRSASRELAHTDRLRDSYRGPVVPVDSI